MCFRVSSVQKSRDRRFQEDLRRICRGRNPGAAGPYRTEDSNTYTWWRWEFRVARPTPTPWTLTAALTEGSQHQVQQARRRYCVMEALFGSAVGAAVAT